MMRALRALQELQRPTLSRSGGGSYSPIAVVGHLCQIAKAFGVHRMEQRELSDIDGQPEGRASWCERIKRPTMDRDETRSCESDRRDDRSIGLANRQPGGNRIIGD